MTTDVPFRFSYERLPHFEYFRSATRPLHLRNIISICKLLITP